MHADAQTPKKSSLETSGRARIDRLAVPSVERLYRAPSPSYPRWLMPSKRDVLGQFTRDELVEAVERFELPVADRRVKDQLLDAVASSKRAGLADVLAGLARDRLKEICRALGLDDAGREKVVLIDRLSGLKAPTVSLASEADGVPAARTERAAGHGRGGSERAASAMPGRVELSPNDRLSVERLEAYLWSAADILRGSIDSSDYKNFIFGLLFLKRLSDRFDEECEALVAGAHNPEDPDEHDFFVPKRARWSEIQKVATNIGETLNKACAALEEKNTALEGVLAGIDYNDERKLGDARNRDAVLARLVQHFSKLNVRNANMSEPDMLGRAYEYLIEKFADDAGKKGGEFYTPRMVVKLIVELLKPAEGMRICDPTCGSGGMLIECAHASLWLMAGGSLADVQRNLGHSTPVLTSETYGHIGEDHRVRESDARLGLGLGKFRSASSGENGRASQPTIPVAVALLPPVR